MAGRRREEREAGKPSHSGSKRSVLHDAKFLFPDFHEKSTRMISKILFISSFENNKSVGQ